MAFALLFYVIIPQGYMIDTKSNSSNGIAIKICNAQGVYDAFIDDKGEISFSKDKKQSQEHDNNADENGNQHCNYSSFSNSNYINPFLEFNFASHQLENLPTIFDIVGIGRGLAAPPPPKTGPPITS